MSASRETLLAAEFRTRWKACQSNLRAQGERANFAKLPPEAPSWPSGVITIDQRADGFYGFSVVAGHPKLGKSMLVQRSAMLAAVAGWDVIHVNCENSIRTLDERAKAILGERSEWPAEADRWVVINAFENATLDYVVGKVADELPSMLDRVLIVIDSVTRLARCDAASTGRSFFGSLEAVVRFCAAAVREFEGNLGIMGVSELNRKGGATGLDIEYTANLMLDMKRGKDPGMVSLGLISRDKPGGDLGDHARIAHECRFRAQLGVADERDERGAL